MSSARSISDFLDMFETLLIFLPWSPTLDHKTSCDPTMDNKTSCDPTTQSDKKKCIDIGVWGVFLDSAR